MSPEMQGPGPSPEARLAQLQAEQAAATEAANQATAERMQAQREFEEAMARSQALGAQHAADRYTEAGVVNGQYSRTGSQLDYAKEVVSSGDAGSRHFARLNYLNNGGEEPKLTFKYGGDEPAPEASVPEPEQANPSAVGKELVLYTPASKEVAVPSKEVALRDPAQGKGFEIVDNPRKVEAVLGESAKRSLGEILDLSKVVGDPKLAEKVTKLEDVYTRLIAAHSRKFLRGMGSLKIQTKNEKGELVTEKFKQSEISDIRRELLEARAKHRDSIRDSVGMFSQEEVDKYLNEVEPYKWAAKLSAQVAEHRVAGSKNSKFVQKWAAKTFSGEGRFGKYLRLALPGYGQFNAVRVARNMAGAKIGDRTVADIQHTAFLEQLDGELENTKDSPDADAHILDDLRHEIGERNIDRNRRRMRTANILGAITAGAVVGAGLGIHHELASNDTVTSAHHAAATPVKAHTAAIDKPLGHLKVDASSVHEKFPWGHFANEYSPAEATDQIAAAAAKADAAGYHIQGWIGQSDGSHARMTLDALQHADPNKFGFTKITAPDGYVYDKQQEIAALLDKFKS